MQNLGPVGNRQYKLPAVRFTVLPGYPPWPVTPCLPLSLGYSEESRFWIVIELILAHLLESYFIALCLGILICKVEIRATTSEGVSSIKEEIFVNTHVQEPAR